jgi:hypothetical protein
MKQEVIMKKRLLSAILAVVVIVTATPPIAQTSASTPDYFCCDPDDLCTFCEPDPPFVGWFRLGDVDGDDVLTIYDAMQILNYVVELPSVFDGDNPMSAHSFYAANTRRRVCTETWEFAAPDVHDAIAILRRILRVFYGDDALSSPLDDVWEDDEIGFGITTGFRGRICLADGQVYYYNEAEIPAYEGFTMAFNSTESVGRLRRKQEVSLAVNEVGSNGDLHYVMAFVRPSAFPAREVFAAQPILSSEIDISDFTLSWIHDDGDLVWYFCECDDCPPPPDLCDCRNCSECGFRGGRFGFGRVTNNPDGLTAADAVAILRYVIGLPSVVDDCPDARAAANIIAPTDDSPTVHDAIAILRRIVELPSVLDDREDSA